MLKLKSHEVWLVAGSQNLYGSEVLDQVKSNSKKIAKFFNDKISVKVKFYDVVTSPELILELSQKANANNNCIGLILCMHTFSPAKMWIDGLINLNKPFLHLNTQFNDKIPWETIDMDFMNLNQSAHGDREFGFIVTKLSINRKVVIGHWKDKDVLDKINTWSRAALARHIWRRTKIARIGDNMREVAVTEGNKVAAQIKFGYSVNGYGLGDLINHIKATNNGKINQLIEEYETLYELSDQLKVNGSKRTNLIESAKIELGLRSFLKEGDFTAFTNTFENLHGLSQVPGIAVQRLMADGYGFAAEGDWKTAALVRAMKVMSEGMDGGNSFMEDYTYHFQSNGSQVLGAHMLEVCPTITNEKLRCEVHPLSIGGKQDPVRLVFNGTQGKGLNASIIDLGNRFRLIVNTLEAIIPKKLPKLPVARALWRPDPDLKLAAEAWILAGGAHHICYSQSVTPNHLKDFAEMLDIEFMLIDSNTKIEEIKNELKWNSIYYANRN